MLEELAPTDGDEIRLWLKPTPGTDAATLLVSFWRGGAPLEGETKGDGGTEAAAQEGEGDGQQAAPEAGEGEATGEEGPGPEAAAAVEFTRAIKYCWVMLSRLSTISEIAMRLALSAASAAAVW